MQTKLKKVLRTCWGLGGSIVFFTMCIIVTPLFFLLLIVLRNKSGNVLIWIANKLFSPIYFALTLIKINSFGQENIPKDKNYIIIGNHSSTIDFMIHAWSSPVLFKYLSKIENTKVPVFGSLIKNITILVKREDSKSTKNSYQNLKDELEKGFSIFIYPEGARNKSDELLSDFYAGAFRMAIETGLPLVVATLVGVREVSNHKRKLDLSPGTIACYWEKPIETTNMSQNDLPELISHARELMLKRLNDKENQ